MPSLPRSADTAIHSYQCPHCEQPPFHEKRGISCHIRIRHPQSASIPYENLEVAAPAPAPAVDNSPREEAIVRVPEPAVSYPDTHAMLCPRCNKRDFTFKRPLPDMCDICRAFFVAPELILSWKP